MRSAYLQQSNGPFAIQQRHPEEPFAGHAARVGDRSASWIGLVPHRRKAFGIDDPAARLGEGEECGHVLGR
jgi:hypothetical protein